MDAFLFDLGHRPEVFLFARDIGQPACRDTDALGAGRQSMESPVTTRPAAPVRQRRAQVDSAEPPPAGHGSTM